MSSSFLEGWANSGQAAPEARRHTVDHGGSFTSNNTPAQPRSGSLASNRSEPSKPSWLSAYEGVDTSKLRKDSTSSKQNISPRNSTTKLSQKPSTTATSGWKALFNSEDRKEKKKQKQKEVDKIILTSRHAATIKTKLATDPKYAEERRRSSASEPSRGIMNGGQNTAHLSAEQQEMRFPHSGPPSLKNSGKSQFHRKGKKGADVEMDMPALERIMSGDDNDDEKSERAQRGREEWIQRRNEAAMRRFTMAEGMEADEEGSERGSVSRMGSWEDVEATSEEMAEGKVMRVDGRRGSEFIGVELDGEAYTPKARPKAGMGGGWKRDEKTGKWTR